MASRLTYENIKKEFEKVNEYEIISKSYKNNHSKLKILHSKCGNSFKMNWNNFKNGQRCPYCFGNMKLKISDIKKIASSYGYRIISKKYINVSSKIMFKHVKCKRKFEMTWNNFQRGQRCPRCSVESRGVSQRLKLPNISKISLKNGYKIISKKYVDNSSKLKFLHIKCKREFYMSWGKFHNGRRCPECAREQTESKIAFELKKYLKKYYNCILEYRILINHKTKKPLSYDIFLVDENIFIEVNGIQHYKFIPYFHKTIENFKYQKEKDRMKRRYANKNGGYIEIDLRKIKTLEESIVYIENIIKK